MQDLRQQSEGCGYGEGYVGLLWATDGSGKRVNCSKRFDGVWQSFVEAPVD